MGGRNRRRRAGMWIATWLIGASVSIVGGHVVQASPTFDRKSASVDVLKGRSGTHKFQVRLERGTFRSSRHRINKAFMENRPVSTVEGVVARGTDGKLPRSELYAFDV